MGIPTYFRYLFEENPHIVTFHPGNCDYLFYDLFYEYFTVSQTTS